MKYIFFKYFVHDKDMIDEYVSQNIHLAHSCNMSTDKKNAQGSPEVLSQQ